MECEGYAETLEERLVPTSDAQVSTVVDGSSSALSEEVVEGAVGFLRELLRGSHGY